MDFTKVFLHESPGNKNNDYRPCHPLMKEPILTLMGNVAMELKVLN